MFFSMQKLLLDLQWLIDIGPRPFRSEASQLVSIGIEERMKKSGWEVQTINLKGNLIGCKGNGHTVFLAHHDTVPKSPGAIDNGVAVASLLELSRNEQLTDICIGFPTGEEVGLIGSTQMVSFIHKWHPHPKELRLVVSLELVGQSSLWVSGLSNDWNEEQLQWLNTIPNVGSEYAYQLVSRIFPEMERSDHKPFHELSIPTMMLLGRNSDGVFPQYHSTNDSKFDENNIPALMDTLENIAKNPIPIATSTSSGLLLWGTLIPSFWVWMINIAAILLGCRQYKQLKDSLRTMGVAVIPLLVLFLLNWLFVTTSFFSSTPEEETALSTMGIESTGWWNAAIFIPAIGLVCFAISKKFIKNPGSAPLLCALFCIPLLVIDPFLAFPMSIGALLSRIWSPLAIVGAVYWIQPSVLRELSFHGLLPPLFWPLFFILLIPFLGNSNVRN